MNGTLISARKEAGVNRTQSVELLGDVLKPDGKPYELVEQVYSVVNASQNGTEGEEDDLDDDTEVSVSLTSTVMITFDVLVEVEKYQEIEEIFLDYYFTKIGQFKSKFNSIE